MFEAELKAVFVKEILPLIETAIKTTVEAAVAAALQKLAAPGADATAPTGT